MKLIEVARQQRDLFNEGIAWIAVWKQAQKNGKSSWFTEDIFPDGGTENDEPVFDDEQKARLAEILALDSDAVLLNGSLHSWLGSADEPLNATSISKGIENHYLMHDFLISRYFSDEEEPKLTESELANIAEREYAIEPDFHGEPDTITIELPATNVKEDILRDLLNSKNSLIDAALGEDCAWQHEYGTDGLPLTDLPIEFADGKVKFEWLRFGADSDAVTAWSTFLAAACKFSKTAKRVTAKDGEVENQKFAFRVFLTKLKLDGAENKWTRRYLLRNLTGDTAFATPESKQRWLEKHGKKAENTEVQSDEVSE
ncbi:hypothetical protein FACS1894132_06730 [Clostridia bacterium]|nr:hypothetical protein FACS1894132_06730 [Clostridia bacterium]